MSIFSKLFGTSGPSLGDALANNATIIDVRSPMEFSGGHVQGSKNIPLDQLQTSLSELPTDRPVVFCCASGARSGVATRMAKSNGVDAINGGPWTTVHQQMRSAEKR